MRASASLTAEAVGLARAIEGLRPPERRLIDDPYAALFLRGPARAALRLAATTPAMVELGRALAATDLVALIAARHHWIDAQLLAALPEIEQVLILGAGYDSRAIRLAPRLRADGRERMVVEIDHPLTASRKARLLAAAGLPATATVQTDLGREPLADALARSPLRAGRPTFVIWEGVTMYLHRSAVVGTLQALAAWLGPGSQLAMDLWVPASGLLGAGERAGRVGLAALGEPLRFAVRPVEIGPLLREGGLREIARSSSAKHAAAHGDRCPDLLALVLAGTQAQPADGEPRASG